MATWSTDFTGTGAEVHASPDGSVVVRLLSAPWLVRHGATGQAIPLALEAGLDWASRFVIPSDGTLYVLGTTHATVGRLNVDSVRVDHLSSTGSLLASKTWTGPTPAVSNSNTFGGVALGPDGGIYVVADGLGSRSVVRLTPDGDRGAEIPVPALIDSRGNSLDLTKPQRLAAGGDGSFLVEGGSSSLWVERIGPTGDAATAWAIKLADNAAYDAVYPAGIAPSSEGGWLAAFGSGWTNSSSGLGFYERKVERLNSDGTTSWFAGDNFEPMYLGGPSRVRHSSMAVLADSVFLATTTPSDPSNSDDRLLSPDNPSATLVRYALDGQYAQALALGAVTDVTELGPEGVVVLSSSVDGASYTLRRFEFEPLVPTAGL